MEIKRFYSFILLSPFAVEQFVVRDSLSAACRVDRDPIHASEYISGG